MGLPKSYETVARFGAVSTTGDRDGEITETGVLPPETLELPTGVIRQRPPAYSAIKVDGERAYRKARRGEAVELPEREVTVTRFEQLWREGDRAAFAIDCSSGTYVRSLVAELGDAYCEQLRRTAIGPFTVDDADDERILPLADALARLMPVVRVEGPAARRAAHGVAIDGEAEGHVLLVDDDGPIAVAEPREGSLLKPVVGFRSS
jgi:tRNA pseudouridine55 synthase